MGLDNGIIIKDYPEARHKTFAMNKLFNASSPYLIEEGKCEVLYWRRQWTYRTRIVNTLSKKYPNAEGMYILTLEDVDIIISILEEMVRDKEKPDNFFRFNFRENLKNVKALKHFMQFNPDIEVYFYDSYQEFVWKIEMKLLGQVKDIKNYIT